MCLAWVRLVRACGSKQEFPVNIFHPVQGQARKSLWIETLNTTGGSSERSRVRLVRACGSKRPCQTGVLVRNWVRLVRACGSKLFACNTHFVDTLGQARKSLWIETQEY